MPTTGYKVNGKKVPSTTTVLGRFKDATGLIIWANNLGLEGKSYFDELKKAGDIGTSFHDLAEIYIKGGEPPIADDPIVHKVFLIFKEWWDSYECEIIFTEKNYNNENLLIGGCPDLFVKKDGKNILIDFKTSKKIYGDHLIQLSAYSKLIRDGDNIEVDEAIIYRFPKDPAEDEAEIKVFSKQDLELGLSQFLLFRKAFDLDKQINKITRSKK